MHEWVLSYFGLQNGALQGSSPSNLNTTYEWARDADDDWIRMLRGNTYEEVRQQEIYPGGGTCQQAVEMLPQAYGSTYG